MSEPPTNPERPAEVSRFEYNLLSIARFLLGHGSPDQAARWLNQTFTPAPQCLTRTCVTLLQDILSKGVVLELIHAGGWRNERFLRRGQPSLGRLWERLPLEERALEFGPVSLEFVFWLTADKPHDDKLKWDANPSSMTPGDLLFLALALQAMQPFDEMVQAMVRKSAFHGNPFCWLMSPAMFTRRTEPQIPDFVRCFRPEMASIIESMQPYLTACWIRSERAKGQLGDWQRLRNQGTAEWETLTQFLTQAHEHDRPDLARFVLHAATSILANRPTQSFWTGGLQGSGPPRLRDRLETQRLALALPRQLETMHEWDRQARTIGYFDEEYPASQLWKEDWERANGADAVEHVRHLLEQLEPLRTS